MVAWSHTTIWIGSLNKYMISFGNSTWLSPRCDCIFRFWNVFSFSRQTCEHMKVERSKIDGNIAVYRWHCKLFHSKKLVPKQKLQFRYKTLTRFYNNLRSESTAREKHQKLQRINRLCLFVYCSKYFLKNACMQKKHLNMKKTPMYYTEKTWLLIQS